MKALLESAPFTPILPQTPPLQVEVLNPETDFGGVVVFMPNEQPVMIEINSGSPVNSVFGRIGDIQAQAQDYAAFYAPKGATAAVTSVFNRTGDIFAVVGDYSQFYPLLAGSYNDPGWITHLSWAKITGAPALFSGNYTDLNFTGGNITSIPTRNFADLQNKPTSLSGYGIVPAAGDYAAFYQPLGSYEVPLTFTLSVHRAGNQISLLNDVASPTGGAGVPQYYGFDSTGTRGFFNFPSVSVPVTSVFGRSGAVVAASNDYTFAQIGSKPTTLAGYGITDPVVLTSGSYANPAWITSLGWSKITGTPSSLAGYGIVDPVVLVTGSYANPAWITSLAWTKLTGVPSFEPSLGNPSVDGQVLSSTAAGVRSWITPSAAAPVSSVFTRTGAVVAQSGDYSAFYPQLSGSYSNPAWITGLAWSKITGTPTSLAGYGILDPVVLVTGSYSDPAWLTALAWSKITGAPSFEPALGNPSVNGQVLSSTTAGVRSWITPGAPAGAALTATNDTNVTATLGGTPATALLVAASLTLGWTGTLAVARGGTGAATAAGFSYFGVKTGTTGAPAFQTGAALATTNDTNVTLSFAGGATNNVLLNAGTITAGWTGTLAAARLNSNVVQGVNNDLNVTGSIASQTLTIGWTGTLGLARGGLGVNASSVGANTVFGNGGAAAAPAFTHGPIDMAGFADGSNAAAGDIGEYVTAAGNNVNLTTGAATNNTSISLTAGDWDVGGSLSFNTGPTTPSVTIMMGGINTTSATLPASAANRMRDDYGTAPYASANGVPFASPVPIQRISIAATTTVYLVAQANFTAGTVQCQGIIWARRVR